jgi:hypothetical protein
MGFTANALALPHPRKLGADDFIHRLLGSRVKFNFLEFSIEAFEGIEFIVGTINSVGGSKISIVLLLFVVLLLLINSFHVEVHLNISGIWGGHLGGADGARVLRHRRHTQRHSTRKVG